MRPSSSRSSIRRKQHECACTCEIASHNQIIRARLAPVYAAPDSASIGVIASAATVSFANSGTTTCWCSSSRSVTAVQSTGDPERAGLPRLMQSRAREPARQVTL